MSSLKSAIKRARKIVKAKEEEANDTSNTYIITDKFEGEPNGALVIILASLDADPIVPTIKPHIEPAIEE